ncbi:carboxypeptidase-like regulatory domain-containing protein, partial [Sediminibacterium sp.]|uniref:beta strand repeat-containing protein n=1 Tax=Sediminibacterium sp. TaxID=1917865 RepID=UPI002B4AB372
MVKTLSSVSVAETNGYQLKLNANGHWFVGMGPAASKSTSGAKPASLGVMPPPSVDILVSNIASTPVLTSAVTTLPPSVSYSNGVVTFTFATANKAITGTVKDGSGTGLANVEVFAHAQGFGSPVFTQTNASGTFSLSVSDYGSYEIGAISDGMPPTTKNIELKNESGLKIYMEGKDVTSILNLTLNKASYTISGKVLNGNSDGVAYAPVFAVDASGNSVFGQTSIDGSYTLFVNNGTWNVRAELPPSKTDSCGAFLKTVTVSSASQANQNITSSNTSCSTLTGSVSVNSSALANVPLFIEEWDNTNNRPLAGGARKNSATDSSGNYSVNLGDGTYRLGTWDPIYGELSVTTTVSGSGTKDITVGALQSIAFSFTGGTSAMNAFVELKNSTDSNKRLTKQINGLNTATTFSVPSGSTYNYFVNVFGIGNYNGSVVANSTTTINLGASNDFITVTGTVYIDSSTSTGKAGALVSFTNATTTVSAVTDDNGEYSIKIKAGSYSVSDSLAGYVPVQATSISFSTNTAAYDFGGSSPDQTSLKTAGYTIEGTVNSSLSVAMTSGYVWGINASSTVVTAQVNGDGTYSLPVTNGTWTIKAVGPRHVETSLAPVTVSGGNQTGKNITLTAADAGTNIPTSTTGMVAASTGGSINDSSASGIKLTAGAGVLDTGSGNVTLNFEKTFTAPDTANYSALGNATFNITATGDSTIKSLSGNAEIQLDYSAILASLPTSTSESDLKLVYYSPERGDYVPVEGGFTVDTSTNKITGFVDHFTDFMIAYSPSTEGVPTAP